MKDISHLFIEKIKQKNLFNDKNIWHLKNEDKYFSDKKENSLNLKIFQTMKKLNEVGMKNICYDENGRGNLRSTLDQACSFFRNIIADRHVNYIEIGPEPVKTSLIIENLLRFSPQKIDYTAIDVNIESFQTMSASLGRYLKENMYFIHNNYNNIDRNDIERDQDITIISMLGFQEGNDTPSNIGSLINRLYGKNTYILSEIQLFDSDLEDHIFSFYQNPYMKEFSSLVAHKFGFVPHCDHEIVLTDVDVDGQSVKCAGTLVKVSRDDQDGYLLTNSCLKYRRDQYIAVRENFSKYKVIANHYSGDRSVVFQISQSQSAL